MRKLTLLFLLIISFYGKASHIVGGDIYYDYLGGNNYRFYITLYRDCFSTGAEYDDPLSLGVFISGVSTPVQEHAIPFPGSVTLPVIFNNPCVVPPNDICVEKAIYTIVLNLPPTVGGYTITYQRCCRGPNVTNLVSPDDTGITLTTHVPGVETGATANSSPRFTNYPPLLLCNNDDLVFDHSATDPDGDQLVYSLVTPYRGGSSMTPAPVPPLAPTYFPVQWASGFNAANPLGPGATIAINPTTGLLTASPSMLGLFVVGVRVQEFRGGVLIGETVRDFLFKVFNCVITMQAILPEQEELATFESYCQGLTVHFENDSYGGTNYLWDFGVPGITTDVSTIQVPTYTYPAPGIYNAMLVVNPGWPCTDTAFMEVNVNNEFEVSYTTIDSVCVIGNSLDFIGISNGPAGTTYDWDFGSAATPTMGTTQNVSDVSFSSPGVHEVTLYGHQASCEASFTDYVTIFAEPVAAIGLPTNYECEGLTVPFENLTSGSSFNLWDFGVSGTNSDTSDLFEPSFTFPAGGTYTITLTAGSTDVCVDTTTVDITVYELLTVAFTHNDSLCITDNSFNFDGTITGPSFTQWQWDFGPNASISNSSNIDVNGVVYNTPGTHTVTLNAWFNQCEESVSDQIFIYREPEINFRDIPGPRCVPAIVDFEDLSIADSPIYYNWDFGDGSTSTEQDPSHLYTDAGDYSVGLQIYTTEGCIDTLYLMQQDLITIHPIPVSEFTVDPIKTDICHSEITFTDLSVGATNIYYWFDDSIYFAHGANLVHQYQTDGWHRPMQIASNDFGCADTSYQTLYIEPFVIYIPNTFTPDGDEFNNIFSAELALEVYDWEMKIYNRWGQVVFESNDPKVGWDGVYNGFMMQDGAYAYVIKYESCEKPGIYQLLTGHVNLLR